MWTTRLNDIHEIPKGLVVRNKSIKRIHLTLLGYVLFDIHLCWIFVYVYRVCHALVLFKVSFYMLYNFVEEIQLFRVLVISRLIILLLLLLLSLYIHGSINKIICHL